MRGGIQMTATPLLSNKLHLKTLSPLHIGDGRKLKAVDSIFQDGWLYALDENKVVAWVAQDIKRTSMFSAAVGGDPRQIRMRDVFTRLGVNDWRQFVAYQVQVEAGSFPKEVATFIKTPDNQPYLPGSSLKGSLRSSWLRGIAIEDKALRSNINQMVFDAADSKKSASQDIEAEVFTVSSVPRDKRSNYDINRLMQLRDSEPLPLSDLRVIEAKVISTINKGSLREKSYSIFIEALAPGVQVDLLLEWQTYLLGESASQLGFRSLLRRIVYLPEYCRAASLNIMDQERDFYSRHGERELAAWFEEKINLYSKRSDFVFPLPLGWGSGYDAKTITDLLDDEIFRKVVETYKYTRGLRKPGRNHDTDWLGAAESPKSRKVAKRRERGQDIYEPIGWVELSILPFNGQDALGQLRSSIAEPPVFPQEMIQPSRKSTGKPPSILSRAGESRQESKPPPIESHGKKPPVIECFTTLPKPGDRFRGAVWFTDDDGTLFVEIPGLSADDLAAARIPRSALGSKKYKDGEKVICKVITVDKDPAQKGHWLVHCELE
jgi:CRISPR type III-A-associated RAMP protein Csm5